MSFPVLVRDSCPCFHGDKLTRNDGLIGKPKQDQYAFAFEKFILCFLLKD
ncbi:MAG: hypothetical protein OXJ52_02600 [Oligoflexia bacterium]|nr:hypothetical protein [Oligoflexia bacterium]